ncbi:MAG: GYD domain-containing protein [Planctomycetota bacterium]|jgi:uncharacterized protein with GYD domain
MQTFYMFGSYNPEAIKGMSADRTKAAGDLVKKAGGELKSIHALLGPQDLVLVADFPGVSEAAKASLGLCKLTGISFSTSPAIAVEDFDKLAADV